jgi:hypothetical protein
LVEAKRCSFLCGYLPEAEQKLIWATQAAPTADIFSQKVEGTAWKSKPSWYIVASKDQTIQPELERFVAKRMGATVLRLTAAMSRCSRNQNSCWMSFGKLQLPSRKRAKASFYRAIMGIPAAIKLAR